ncbi:WXG100 family type VII secretion target [Nocardia wallacei]|uniref:WXG100 family type VII secretion target n=1 Tax=Nocardia wallacei TaxID=480035 RepID=UPI0024551172|nr:WXG100 family type VII secretion target [Nocardia wallacei]
MADSLRVDPADLRASASELRQRADEAARIAQELRAALADEGACWGDDEPGEAFAQTYQPDAARGMEGLEDLVADLEAMSTELNTSAEAFESQDRSGARGLADAAGSDATTAYPGLPTADPFASDVPRSVPSEYPAATDPPDRPAESDLPTDAPAEPDPTDLADSDAGEPDSGNADSGTAEPQQSPDQTQPGDTPDSDPSGDDRSGDDAPGDENANQPPTAEPRTPTPGDTTGRGNSPGGAPPQTPGQRSSAQPGSARSGGGPGAETPWSRNASGSPWSRPSGAQGPPAGETPPRVSPPRGPAQARPPAAGKPASAPRRDSRQRPEKPMPASSRRPSDAEAMRIVRDMAARHDLGLEGFDTAGLAVQTAQDIADAVDLVLARYPAVLGGIEIVDETEPLSTVEERGTATTVAPWILLSQAAAADPALLTARDQTATGPIRMPRRPMYAAILRELGGAIDLAGGRRARREAQRALITEYLRLQGAQGETLAQVVGGYRRWRAQLGEQCFERGVFAPGRALAECFAAVEAGGAEVSAPAKVLHRMLLTMLRTDPDRSSHQR